MLWRWYLDSEVVVGLDTIEMENSLSCCSVSCRVDLVEIENRYIVFVKKLLLLLLIVRYRTAILLVIFKFGVFRLPMIFIIARCIINSYRNRTYLERPVQKIIFAPKKSIKSSAKNQLVKIIRARAINIPMPLLN